MMDFEPALKDLDKALRLAPSKMDAHFQRAQVLLGLERYSEAHHALREALERGYNATEVHNWQVRERSCVATAGGISQHGRSVPMPRHTQQGVFECSLTRASPKRVAEWGVSPVPCPSASRTVTSPTSTPLRCQQHAPCSTNRPL
jgi:hypothetical protein